MTDSEKSELSAEDKSYQRDLDLYEALCTLDPKGEDVIDAKRLCSIYRNYDGWRGVQSEVTALLKKYAQ